MIKPTIRTLRSGRVYPGENASYLLVRWLNGVHANKAVAQISSLIELLKNLGKVEQDFPGANLNPHSRRGLIGTKAQFENLKKSTNLNKAIDEILARYEFRMARPDVMPQWNPSWVRTPNRFKLKIRIIADGDDTEVVFGDADAVTNVLRLAEQGYLPRLRKCRCGKWLYARFDRKLYCSVRCRRKYFRATDSFRADQREYMRDYRARLAKQAGIPFKPRPRKLRNPATK